MAEDVSGLLDDPESFREWLFKEMKASADLLRDHKDRNEGEAQIQRGMIRGMRHVAERLDIPGLDRSTLRDYEERLLGSGKESGDASRSSLGQGLRDRMSHSTYEERWMSPEEEQIKIFVGPEPERPDIYLAWADYRGERWTASALGSQQEAVERLRERLKRKDPKYGKDWGPPY